MTVPPAVTALLWELGDNLAYQPFFHDITLLCIAAARDGLLEDHRSAGWRMREGVCAALADTSIVWRGTHGKNAHGLWRAPDGQLVWWTNSDVGCAWCRVHQVARGALDLLLQEADALLVNEVRRTGYRRWAA